ncbi:outer membrane protein assembly factor BamD [Chelatococcus reniformis]|uniref:Outer membrane protein assembly factor BamD n=1 Tax=Chelatococcus reniformis TaxID=1494448 RepID=A0A916UCJ6_9HYPH|nr:outer membrane protein assembly factor BamD [Chelatococcus reniformis]GGC67276.1 outer membrane protein assembly factor BamD [Chelatococcus reniformis]
MRFVFSSGTVSNATVRAALVAVSALSLSACSETFDKLNPFADEKYKPEVVEEVPAANLYNDGLARMSDSNFTGASKKFSDLEKQHPYSPYAKKALLMTAYTNYESGSYDDAIQASKRYLTLHPGDKDAAYAQYLMAMSYYSMAPDVSRDQEQAEKAGVALQELVQRYPTSEYVKDAKWKLQVIQDQLAGKEMEVGRYYLNRRNYTAAINRFRVVVSRYQTTRHVEEALERLTEAYMALGIVNEAQTAAAVLGHNFPDSPWYKDAHALLAKGGASPREDRGSWISRSFRSVVGLVSGSN